MYTEFVLDLHHTEHLEAIFWVAFLEFELFEAPNGSTGQL